MYFVSVVYFFKIIEQIILFEITAFYLKSLVSGNVIKGKCVK